MNYADNMITEKRVLTLEEFRKRELRTLPQATGELSGLLQDIALAAKRVAAEVNKAGLLDILGDTGEHNVQGEKVQKLDKLLTGSLKHRCKEESVAQVCLARNRSILFLLMSHCQTSPNTSVYWIHWMGAAISM